MQNDQEKKSGLARIGYIWNDWISTFIILALLLMTLLIGTGEMIHGQMLRMGERLYGDQTTGMQYSFLRAEPENPSCDRHPDIETQVQEQMKANAADEFASMGVQRMLTVRKNILHLI